MASFAPAREWDQPNRAGKQAILRPRGPAPAAEIAPLKPVKKGARAKQDAPPPPSILRQTKTHLSPFAAAPFPYEGMEPRTNKPFLNVAYGGRRGHRTWGGHVYWEDETYNDSRVLLHIPKGFDYRKPAVMILFFHGHGATLKRDVLDRQQVPAQISASGINAVLVAPQLAVDARDSSVGKLWESGGVERFMKEAAAQLAQLHGDPRSRQAFEKMPVIVMAYSGGYVAAASCLSSGGLSTRLRGVVLLDALYGDLDKFSSWISKRHSAFFLSAYAASTRARNSELASILKGRDLNIETKLQRPLRSGSITFISTAPETAHRDFVTRAWVDQPIKDLLQRLRADAR